ncbi:MAG: mycothiol system anti-sigma-R factor [Micrococcales bacterium]|nr:mycothiol system anti-sigma-R factor [Micrococcales bacterium]
MTTPDALAHAAAFEEYDCEKALPRLYEFIDDELTIDELQAMQDHLDGCDSCAYEHTVRHKLKTVIHEVCFEPAPDELKERVAANIAKLRAQFAGQAS